MRNSSYTNVVLLLSLLLMPLLASAQGRMTRAQYIKKYTDIVVEDQRLFGIPASVKMAQAILESDCGNSRLAVEGNNHFGIKCKKDWKGKTILHDDDSKGECFRKYRNAAESFRDHSEFLDRSPRYRALFDLDITDYKGWAHGLKKAGYATNPRYAELLIKIIEDEQLYLLGTAERLYADDKPSGQSEPDPGAVFTPAEKVDTGNYFASGRTIGHYIVYNNNGSEFVVARAGDTYAAISRLSKVSEKRLRKFNDADKFAEPKNGEQVYLKSKGKRANDGKLMHVVREGETMHSISQKYGIKLNRLVKMNRRSAGARLTAGQQIRLR